MDVEVSEGLGDLDLEMERMRSAGVGSRRWPVESVDEAEAVVDVEAVCRVTALPSRAAARRSGECRRGAGGFRIGWGFRFFRRRGRWRRERVPGHGN